MLKIPLEKKNVGLIFRACFVMRCDSPAWQEEQESRSFVRIRCIQVPIVYGGEEPSKERNSPPFNPLCVTVLIGQCSPSCHPLNRSESLQLYNPLIVQLYNHLILQKLHFRDLPLSPFACNL